MLKSFSVHNAYIPVSCTAGVGLRCGRGSLLASPGIGYVALLGAEAVWLLLLLPRFLLLLLLLLLKVAWRCLPTAAAAAADAKPAAAAAASAASAADLKCRFSKSTEAVDSSNN